MPAISTPKGISSSSTASRISRTTARGTRFSPQYIENKLKFSPYVAEAVILGAGRDYLAAMICIRFSIVSRWAEKKRISFTTYTDLASRPEVYALIRKEIEARERDAAAGPAHRQVPAALQGARRRRRRVDPHPEGAPQRHRRKIRRHHRRRSMPANRQIDIDTLIRFQDGTTQRVQTTLAVVDLDAAAPGPVTMAAE